MSPDRPEPLAGCGALHRNTARERRSCQRETAQPSPVAPIKVPARGGRIRPVILQTPPSRIGSFDESLFPQRKKKSPRGCRGVRLLAGSTLRRLLLRRLEFSHFPPGASRWRTDLPCGPPATQAHDFVKTSASQEVRSGHPCWRFHVVFPDSSRQSLVSMPTCWWSYVPPWAFDLIATSTACTAESSAEKRRVRKFGRSG